MLGAHVAAVSQHLAKLRTAGLVESRRDGTRIYYRAVGPHVRGLLEEAALAASASFEDPAPTGPPATPARTRTAQSAARAPARARRPLPE